MKLVFMGTPDFAVVTLKALIAADFKKWGDVAKAAGVSID